MSDLLKRVLIGAAIGLGVGIIVGWGTYQVGFINDLLDGYEFQSFDARMRAKVAGVEEASIDDVVIIDIEQESVRPVEEGGLGRYYNWPQAYHGQLIDVVTSSLQLFWSPPEGDVPPDFYQVFRQPEAQRKLLYDFNSDKIKPSAQVDLLYLLGLMEDNPEISLELSSHTDTRGVDAYNLDLSQRRANSVVKWLTDNGVNPDRLRAVGYGETRPAEITSQQEQFYPFVKEGDILTMDFINALDTPQKKDIAHALNRRTEVSITNTVIRKILGGSLELMLLDLDDGALVNQVSSDFIGSQKDLYDRVQNMSWQLVANFGLDKCKRGLGALLVPIIIVGGGAGYYAYTEMTAEEESIGAPPGLPEDCCGK